MFKFIENIQKQLITTKPIILEIAPAVEKLPLPMRRYDDPFLPFSKSVIKASRNHVAGYMFDFPAYLALGAAGAIALERSIAFAQGTVTILHGAFATSQYTSVVADTGFSVDAVTVQDPVTKVTFDDSGTFAILINGDANAVYDTAKSVVRLSTDLNSNVLTVLGDDVIYSDAGDDFEHTIHSILEAKNFD